LQENFYDDFSSLSHLENNILKVVKNWVTRSDPIMTSKKMAPTDGNYLGLNVNNFYNLSEGNVFKREMNFLFKVMYM